MYGLEFTMVIGHALAMYAFGAYNINPNLMLNYYSFSLCVMLTCFNERERIKCSAKT